VLNERFATELRKLMESHEPPLSIAEMADQLGLTYEFIRKLVRGYNLPTRGSLIILSRIFGIDVDWLESLVKEDKLAQEFGRETARILSNPDTKALVAGMAELDDAGKIKVLDLLNELLERVDA
jgi:transcriptional regulator with XRE-family HTH domain